jgi:hypothetical protein
VIALPASLRCRFASPNLLSCIGGRGLIDEGVMAYKSCKNCGNDEGGTEIYACKSCGKIYCENCIPNGECGNCGKEWFPTFISLLPFAPDNMKTLGSVDDD